MLRGNCTFKALVPICAPIRCTRRCAQSSPPKPTSKSHLVYVMVYLILGSTIISISIFQNKVHQCLPCIRAILALAQLRANAARTNQDGLVGLMSRYRLSRLIILSPSLFLLMVPTAIHSSYAAMMQQASHSHALRPSRSLINPLARQKLTTHNLKSICGFHQRSDRIRKPEYSYSFLVQPRIGSEEQSSRTVRQKGQTVVLTPSATGGSGPST